MIAKHDLSALDTEASPERLASLLDKDDATNRLLARHPRAGPELLEKLSHSSDRATRRAVVINPNTPPETYIRLGQQFPKEFLANPQLDLLLMVNPGLMEAVPVALVIRLLKQADCPASMLEWAAGHREVKVQLAVAMNARASDQAIERLRASSYSEVLDAIRSGSDSVELLEPEQEFEREVRHRLASLPNETLYRAWNSDDIGLAQWDALPLGFRLAVATGSDVLNPEAIVQVLRRATGTLELIRGLFPTYTYWTEVAANTNTPASALALLATDSEESVRCNVARNPSAPTPTLEMLAKDSLATVRQCVARNPSTPLSVLEALASDFGSDVRQGFANNQATSPQVLQELSADGDLTVRRTLAVNPLSSAQILEGLAQDSDEGVRRGVASNPSASGLALKVLSMDSSWVRSAVARNHSAPASVLETMAKDLDHWVRTEVAKNRSASMPVLELLANDSSERVREAVAGNSSASVLVLELLAKDLDEQVRVAVAANPSTSLPALARLASDRSYSVVIAAIHNQNTPLSALSRLLKSKSMYVRPVLAEKQAHRFEEIFRTLLADTNIEVRQALALNSKIKVELLDELAHSAVSEAEWVALLCNPSVSASSAQLVTDRLFTTNARESAWFLDQVSEASGEVYEAATEGRILSYFGKSPDKALLSKRALAPLMALCAGSPLQPSRIVKLVGSTDWLVRAAVARHPSTPPNLVKKLTGDTHPLVARLARNRHEEETSSNG